MEIGQCDRERWTLLALSNERALSDVEAARLAAVTHHFNVRNALIFLAGRPHTDFGFDGVDQVHGNRWIAACGCQLHHVFDHHKAIAGEPREVHAHTPRHVCEAHAPHWDPRGAAPLHHRLGALHQKVQADNTDDG